MTTAVEARDVEVYDDGTCWNCGGRGYTVTCVDDMCHGQDECIHGDPPTPCHYCNRHGTQEDRGP